MRLGFLRHRGRIADLTKLEAGQLPLDTAVVIDVQRGGLAFIGRRAWVALRPRVGRRQPADARARLLRMVFVIRGPGASGGFGPGS